ncbi:hypothetical protein, conserved [Leishmania lindenbergi]|uniref:Uncharacterized protein n=1 Tax=Leishmania lindenbergi TaxID=651832 RepID=A0AAW3ASE0_9TRYP
MSRHPHCNPLFVGKGTRDWTTSCSGVLLKAQYTLAGARHRNQLRLFVAHTHLEADRHSRLLGVDLQSMRGTGEHVAEVIGAAMARLATLRAFCSHERAPVADLLLYCYMTRSGSRLLCGATVWWESADQKLREGP